MELELNFNEGIIDLIEKCIDVVFCIGVLCDLSLYVWLIGYSCICVVVSFEYL